MAEITHNDVDMLSDEAQVVEINGNRFVAGLTWVPVDESLVKGEIKRFTQEESMNLVVVQRTLMSAHIGFGRISTDPKRQKQFAGAYSLALALIKRLGDSWLGIFDLGGGSYSLIAVHEGAVVPGYDVIGGIRDVENALREIYYQQSWGKVYVQDVRIFDNANVDIPSVEDRDDLGIGDILENKKWDSALKVKVIRKGVSKKMLIGGAVFLVLAGIAAGGYWFYENYYRVQMEKEAAIAEEYRVTKLNKDRMAAIKELQALAPKPGWPNEPDYMQSMLRCEKAILNVPLSFYGWDIESASCDATNGLLTASFVRGEGLTMIGFFENAQRLKDAGHINGFDVNPDTGALYIALPPLPPRGEDGAMDEKEWIRLWVSLFQVLGHPTTLKHVPHPPPPEPERRLITLLGKDKATPPPPWWEVQEWEFSTTGVSPSEVLRDWPGTGFILKNITVATKDGLSNWSWSAKGEVNLKP